MNAHQRRITRRLTKQIDIIEGAIDAMGPHYYLANEELKALIGLWSTYQKLDKKLKGKRLYKEVFTIEPLTSEELEEVDLILSTDDFDPFKE